MKKNMFLPSILIILLILAGYLLSRPKKLVVGFCPTMATYVTDLPNKENIALVAYNSSQEALSNLASNKVDCVLIGRKARSHEMSDTVLFRQLDNNATTLVKATNTDDSEAFLLPWRDVDYSQVDLVVVTDEKGNKLVEYRTPFLYYSKQIDSKHIDQVASLIREKI